jgi:hypothetical protein
MRLSPAQSCVRCNHLIALVGASRYVGSGYLLINEHECDVYAIPACLTSYVFHATHHVTFADWHYTSTFCDGINAISSPGTVMPCAGIVHGSHPCSVWK